MRDLVLPDLWKICDSFMCERKVKVERSECMMERRCPQGSSLGPTLCLMAIEGWFETMDTIDLSMRQNGAFRRDCYSQEYTDDEVLMVYWSSVKAIENVWGYVWEGCSLGRDLRAGIQSAEN